MKAQRETSSLRRHDEGVAKATSRSVNEKMRCVYRCALWEYKKARIYVVKDVRFATSKTSPLCLVAPYFFVLFHAIDELDMV